MPRAALVVGIDHYPGSELLGCQLDARRIDELLSESEQANGQPEANMEVTRRLSSTDCITAETLLTDIEQLVSADLECAVFYFAGHSFIHPRSREVCLMTPEGSSSGVPLSEIFDAINSQDRGALSVVVILDTCHAGAAGEDRNANGLAGTSSIGKGVTILASSDRSQVVEEDIKGGMFSNLVALGLAGRAADILGRVTPASIYTFVDQNFGSVGQRPVYKANVSRFIELRKCKPSITRETLLQLPTWFPASGKNTYPLTVAHEPDRKGVPKHLENTPKDPDKEKVFAQLQACNRVGLVVPVGAKHMYNAAIEERSCKLTPIGLHYRDLAIKKRI